MRDRSHRYVFNKECVRALGKGRKEMGLPLGRSSMPDGSRNWRSWQPCTPQMPPHQQNHSQFTVPVWKYDHSLCLPTVLASTTDIAMKPYHWCQDQTEMTTEWEPAEKWPQRLQARWWHKKLSLLEADLCPSYPSNIDIVKRSEKKKQKQKEEEGKRSLQRILGEWDCRLDIV